MPGQACVCIPRMDQTALAPLSGVPSAAGALGHHWGRRRPWPGLDRSVL